MCDFVEEDLVVPDDELNSSGHDLGLQHRINGLCVRA
jgi:hypothetical protein